MSDYYNFQFSCHQGTKPTVPVARSGRQSPEIACMAVSYILQVGKRGNNYPREVLKIGIGFRQVMIYTYAWSKQISTPSQGRIEIFPNSFFSSRNFNMTQTPLQIFPRFLRFGLLAWGGPVAQIAMIKKELVEDEQWVSKEQFNRALAV